MLLRARLCFQFRWTGYADFVSTAISFLLRCSFLRVWASTKLADLTPPARSVCPALGSPAKLALPPSHLSVVPRARQKSRRREPTLAAADCATSQATA